MGTEDVDEERRQRRRQGEKGTETVMEKDGERDKRDTGTQMEIRMRHGQER